MWENIAYSATTALSAVIGVYVLLLLFEKKEKKNVIKDIVYLLASTSPISLYTYFAAGGVSEKFKLGCWALYCTTLAALFLIEVSFKIRYRFQNYPYKREINIKDYYR